MGPRYFKTVIATAAGIFAVLYLFPTLLEFWIAPRTGPFVAYVVLGDLVGCVAVGLCNWKSGVITYVATGALKAMLLHSVSLTVLAFAADIVPTVLFGGIVVSLLWETRPGDVPRQAS